MPRLLVHFARFGPYHHARLRAAHDDMAPLGWEVMGLEIAGRDATYAWDESKGAANGPRVITAFPGKVHEKLTSQDMRRDLHPLLDALKPDAIVIAGWASVDAFACLAWGRRNHRRGIVMSETREADGRRVWWKEWIKRHRISRFDGALVGGKAHRDYLTKLGMPAGSIQFGYNVVDNAFFAAETERWRNPILDLTAHGSHVSGYSTPCFLASNRFIKRKNMERLIRAYAAYVHPSTISNHGSAIWNLCLLGDGELKPTLLAQCRTLGLNVIESAPWEQQPATGNRSLPTVFFPGFRQIEELPRFYAHAGCFVHPALEEPWGLVLNEAMACGLPVLSGSNVGAAEELVEDGVNGWCFDATDEAVMAECLGKVAGLSDGQRLAMGSASARILEERCPTGAFGRGLAAILQGACRQAPQF